MSRRSPPHTAHIPLHSTQIDTDSSGASGSDSEESLATPRGWQDDGPAKLARRQASITTHGVQRAHSLAATMGRVVTRSPQPSARRVDSTPTLTPTNRSLSRSPGPPQRGSGLLSGHSSGHSLEAEGSSGRFLPGMSRHGSNSLAATVGGGSIRRTTSLTDNRTTRRNSLVLQSTQQRNERERERADRRTPAAVLSKRWKELVTFGASMVMFQTLCKETIQRRKEAEAMEKLQSLLAPMLRRAKLREQLTGVLFRGVQLTRKATQVKMKIRSEPAALVKRFLQTPMVIFHLAMHRLKERMLRLQAALHRHHQRRCAQVSLNLLKFRAIERDDVLEAEADEVPNLIAKRVIRIEIIKTARQQVRDMMAAVDSARKSGPVGSKAYRKALLMFAAYYPKLFLRDTQWSKVLRECRRRAKEFCPEMEFPNGSVSTENVASPLVGRTQTAFEMLQNSPSFKNSRRRERLAAMFLASQLNEAESAKGGEVGSVGNHTTLPQDDLLGLSGLRLAGD